MLTIERVAHLSRIDIFANTPGKILAAVARIVEEVDLPGGETFIEEGTIGDSLYIIIDGRVRVHSGDHTIIELGPGDSVGELAALDPAPRSASVTTLEPTFLFQIARDPFAEVMADRPEISQGVIRALVRRIREQGRRNIQV
jgi:CRP-like cAMP-binding protein